MTGKRIKIVLFIITIGFILWMTIFTRHSSGVHTIEMRPFWGFQEMLAGNPNWKLYATYWIKNVLLFMPFGFLLPCKDLRFALIVGVIFSIVIEIIQYFACLGLCELDDVICNGLGTFLGFRMFAFVQKFIKRSNREHGAE